MLHRDIESLQPETQEKVKKLLKLLSDKKILYAISETFREQSVQQAYYAQGRRTLPVVNDLRHSAGLSYITDTDNKKIITNCDGVKLKSKHQSGRAIDIVPVNKDGKWLWGAPYSTWEQIGVLAESVGLTWGGRWKALPDSPHIEDK